MLLDEWIYATRTFKVANGLFWFTFLVVTVAFSTPYWLVSVADENLPNPKFTRLGKNPALLISHSSVFLHAGLWEFCLNGFRDRQLQYERVFTGCLHIFQEDYDIIRHEIQPAFFVATQFFYTLCFVGFLVAILMLLMYFFCISDYYRVGLLRWLGVNLIATGALGAVGVIIFGACGDSRDFMPDWEHNYHSWSFGLAVVGVLAAWVDGILFLVEARRGERWQKARDKQYTVEREV